MQLCGLCSSEILKSYQYSNNSRIETIIHRIEEEVASEFAAKIRSIAENEVKVYIQSEEYRLMVEGMKRRERERVLAIVQSDFQNDKQIEVREDDIKEKKMRRIMRAKQDAEEKDKAATSAESAFPAIPPGSALAKVN